MSSHSYEIESLVSQLLTPLHALKLDAEYHENSFATSQSKLALDMLESTLLLHRINARQTQLDLEPVHVGDVVVHTLASMREYFYSNNIDYELEIQKGVPAVTADRSLLEHAVKMLCYGTHMFNQKGAVIRLKIRKSSESKVTLSMQARELETKTIVLRKNTTQNIHNQSPIETARSLLTAVGGSLQKTHTLTANGFLASLPVSEQLSLV